MRIEDITATPVTIGFNEPEIWSQGKRLGVTAIVVHVLTRDGLTGVGESVPAPSPQVTLAAIESVKPFLLGKDPRRINQLWLEMQSRGGFVSFPYTGNAALAGVEIACWDLLGKAAGQPVHALLGGPIREAIPMMGFVQNTVPKQIEADARRMVEHGFTTLYTKVGIDKQRDIAAMEALRRGGGAEAELRCDANEAWTPGTALRMAHALAHLNIQYIEQPIRMRSLDELATLRRRSPVPIAANQSSWLNWDVIDILRAGAADVIMTDPWQAGGIGNFNCAADMCASAGIPLVYHSFAPLSIATRAAVQVLAMSPACIFAHQTYHHMLVDDVVKAPVKIEHGHITVDDRPGIGVEIDEDKLNHYHEAYQKSGYVSAYGDDDSVTTCFIPNQ